MSAMEIAQATAPSDLAQVRALFEEYAAWVGVDLCFQGFPAELKGLPGAYAPPRGRLFLARAGSETAGCVGLRPIEENLCEMKRLYVRPAFRGRGLGRTLVEKVVWEARDLGYRALRLDTLPKMVSAAMLYRAMGFAPCPPYYDTPLEGTVFLELVL